MPTDFIRDEKDQFLERHSLPKLAQEEISNQNSICLLKKLGC